MIVRVALLSLLCALPARAGDLEAEVRRVLAKAPQAKLGVRVEAVGDAAPLLAIGDARPLVPASNMKLLTSASALQALGPGHVLETKLLWTGRDLWIVGAGDPTISRRFDEGPLLDALAKAAAAKGVKAVGDLIYDARVFDDERLHPAWETSDAERWYGAEVAGLCLNDNCIDVRVAGGPPRAVLDPETRYVTIDVQARTGKTRWGIVRTGADKRTWRLTGRIAAKAKPGYAASVPVPDPARFFATVLRERLAARGVTVKALRAPRDGEQPQGQPVWSRQTKLSQLLPVVNQNSQNLYAECLLKLIGATRQRIRAGSWERGARTVTQLASAVFKLPAGQVTVSDGSGLSRKNRLSTRAIARLLQAVLAGPHAERFHDSLAAPGGKGTLRRRLRRLPKGVTLRAKTGTLTRVAAVSGVLSGPGRRRWVFSLIANGKGARHRLLDEVIRILAKHLAG